MSWWTEGGTVTVGAGPEDGCGGTGEPPAGGVESRRATSELAAGGGAVATVGGWGPVGLAARCSALYNAR